MKYIIILFLFISCQKEVYVPKEPEPIDTLVYKDSIIFNITFPDNKSFYQFPILFRKAVYQDEGWWLEDIKWWFYEGDSLIIKDTNMVYYGNQEYLRFYIAAYHRLWNDSVTFYFNNQTYHITLYDSVIVIPMDTIKLLKLINTTIE